MEQLVGPKETQIELLKLREAGLRAMTEYLSLRPIKIGIAELDEVFEGGLEQGDFYLFIGASKSGKSTVLRNIGLTMARKSPVLYLNFEQLGRNVFSALYKMHTGRAFRDDLETNKDLLDDNIMSFPDIPFYMAFWTDKLESKAFNVSIKDYLKLSIKQIEEIEGERPVVILENFSDIYNERIGAKDSVENVASQTIMDIKNFCKDNEIAMLLAHHTPKLGGNEPTTENGRDSNRIADLAHSILSCHVEETKEDYLGTQLAKKVHILAYLRGRSTSDSKKWSVNLSTNGGFSLAKYEKRPEEKKFKVKK